MLRKFALWFVCFGLSFLAQHIGWAEQGTAFVWINIGATLLLIAVIIVIALIAGDGIVEKAGLSFLVAIFTGIGLGITLFATWGATQLFDVNFTVAYQIMTFGQCLVTSSKKDN